jgi:hypothetical protein
MDEYDVRVELDRKSIQTLDQLISRHDAGEISGEAFKVAVRAIFDTVSGLVESDTFELISHVSAAPIESVASTRIFFNDAATALLQQPQDLVGVELGVYRRGKLHKHTVVDCENEPNPRAARKRATTMIVKALLDKGFKEL